ncbi:HD domain-containing protein [Salsipaludibacter albus]|uniref:HD domain-containing protein n=1 Tax=Salsipaludibacter albus TaxID=2849650 RepID=UPI001EE3B864|nr:HD domain-containing protein [Salsipaludibacter albus]MBY5162409.1 HD domain-containing protein [Salsipaludibacter albus]
MATLTIGTTVEEVLALVDELDEIQHARTDLRTLALRAAGLALDEGGDDELVTATLLHDIGRARYLSRGAPGVPHEEVSRRFVAERFSDRAAWLVAQHVVAQRYLATVDESYVDGLNGPQRTALRRHGTSLSSAKVLRFESHDHAADAVRLRRWSDRAVDPSVGLGDLDRIGRAMAGAWVHAV